MKIKWRRLMFLGILWFVALFPIPILPFLGINLSNEAITAILIILTIITIPFFFLSIFMK